MKTRILLFCISCLLWASCGNSGQNYVIEGTLPSVKYDGEWIYLVPMENAPGRVDSVKITNASFSFSGQGEEMRVLRLRHLLRIYIQELLVVTEPGTIHVKADSVGSVTGTPQNDALQKWKEGREKKQEAYHFIRTGLRNATGKDSLHLIRIRDSLRMQEQETNFLFLKEQGNNTLGTFMRKMVRGSLTEDYGMDEIRANALYKLTSDYSVSVLQEWREEGGSICHLLEVTAGNTEYANGLLRMNVIDEIILYVVPTIDGNGAHFFKSALPMNDWRLMENKTYRDGVIRLTYHKEPRA